ncbi:serine hydrolase domain-containing protein [Sphingomonas sp.]|uniref:serine hydrolase domain-containing protein n=1 Tax=Sphingomonas sp. TaxID=28214 RepID=UPI00286C8554|nr:serine hydrolase domain-containing protein [Sphingomonas sp.]
MKLAIHGAAALLSLSACTTPSGRLSAAAPVPTAAVIDATVAHAMASTGAKGLALAVIDDGRPVYVKSFGIRNPKGDPLRTDTIMYGASLTKALFAFIVMQLVDEGKLNLDTPIERYLANPLPAYSEPDVEDRYARWSDLAGDDRWRKLTPRILLTHSPGFANFGFLEPDGKLRFHFDPGARYAYSGDGIILLQFVIERGLGLDLGREMQRRIFDRFGMANTSMIWRPDFRANLADGWDMQGKVEPHDERSAVRAAGSMDTSIADFARFAAAFARGEGLTARSRAEITRGQLPITTRTQFPTLQPELPSAERRPDLAAGLGVITFTGPQGPGFEKGGHNDVTGNSWVCVERRRSCVVLLSNDVRAEAAFPDIVRAILGETGAPYAWTKSLP